MYDSHKERLDRETCQAKLEVVSKAKDKIGRLGINSKDMGKWITFEADNH